MIRSRVRIGRRVPLLSLTAMAVLVLVLPSTVAAANWTDPVRVSTRKDSRLDSLHQLASAGGRLHLIFPRIGPTKTDDRVIYQRSGDAGATWSSERTLFSASTRYRNVVPNLAIDANGSIVVAAWRVLGPTDAKLFVRVSRDGGLTFGSRQELSTAPRKQGIGVPAVAIGDDVIAVAWTQRGNGTIRVRSSRNEGRSFGPAKTIGKTSLSIDCRQRITDGLVGVAAFKRRIYVAWSYAPKRACQAASIRMRTSPDRGKAWNQTQFVTKRRTYGWPELGARGHTVVATVQSPTGGLVVARSGQYGRNWSDNLIKPRSGHSLSAADIELLPRQKAIITYVDERVRRSRLVNTTLVSRRSRNDGASYLSASGVTGVSKRLLMAPNVAASGSRVTIVFQAGPLDASRRNLFVTRQR